jgi:class 3 adenylate cyclase
LAPGALEASAQHLEPTWGTGVGLGSWAPSVAHDPEQREAFGLAQRMAASPGAAMALMSSYMDIDVRAALPLIRVPTLVMHRSGDRMIPAELGRYLAEHIDGAQWVLMEGTDHFWWSEDEDVLVDHVEQFLTGTTSAPEPDRVLATVLFTDIVDSTGVATRLGDREWKRLLDRHDTMAAAHVERHRGRLVKTTGDGVLAMFDGPARAVRCATAITQGAVGLGVEVRAGAHTGEVELRGTDVAGVAVHLAQRVCGLAEAGEVLVSRTLVDLVVGSGLDFTDRGEHELRGAPGSWRVFAAAPH